MSEGKSPRAVILWLIGLWLLVASLGAFLGSTRSPLRAMAAALLFLPAGLWMLLPVGRESWPNGIGELALCAAYWLIIVGLQLLSMRRRSLLFLSLPYFLVLLSFGGCFVGDPHKVFVVHG